MPIFNPPSEDADRRAQWEKIGEMRREQIEQDRKLREERERTEKEQTVQQQAAALQELHSAQERAAKREEWRQAQHEKRREEEAERRKAEELKRMEEERKKKEAAAQEEQRTKMQELHEQAVRKKVEQQIATARHEEEHAKQRVTLHQEGQSRALDLELAHVLEHLASDRRKELQKMEQEAQRRRQNVLAKVDVAKKAAARSRDPLLEQALLDAKRLFHREQSDTDAWVEQQTQDIRIRFEQLEAEARRDSERKMRLTAADADRRRKEAEKRREGTEGFLRKNG